MSGSRASRRGTKGASHGTKGASCGAKGTSSGTEGSAPAPALVVAGALAALVVWTALALAGRAPLEGWYYQLAWYTTLLALDAGLGWREGSFPLVGRPRFALSLFLWSVPVWLLFELINFRVANWYYVNVSDSLLVRRAGTTMAFATVLPAIYMGHRWARSLRLARRWRAPGFQVRAWHPAALTVLGLAFLGLTLWRPDLFYPLIWGAVTLLLEPWNLRREPQTSLFGDLARGEYGRIARLLAGGLAIGLLWELFNAPALTRWIYTVPGLEGGKLFEMPLPGYLGFPVFALDCFVIYQALVNLGVAIPGWTSDGPAARSDAPGASQAPGTGSRPGRTAGAALLAIVFSLAVMAGIDWYTVDSRAPTLEDLPGVGAEEAATLRELGWGSVDAVAEATPDRLRAAGISPEVAAEAVETARLATLRGIGMPNAHLLRRAGAGTVCDLARADWRELSAAVDEARPDPHAGRPARVRVWIRAARDACAA